MLHYSLYLYKVQKSNLFTITIPGTLAITPINLVSLTIERCYSAFTRLYTSAIVLERE